MDEKLYDIVILLGPDRFEQLSRGIRLIKKHLKHREIKVISSSRFKNDIETLGAKYICEDELYSGLTFKNVETVIKKLMGDSHRTGWYFQQFLKMAYAYKCQDMYYLIWDADTIPGRDIEFLSTKGKILFNMKNERHSPYFYTIDKLFNGQLKVFNRRINQSFISEGMLIKKEIMEKMLFDIEKNSTIYGKFFWEKILYAIGEEGLLKGGFSEFETYGNYLRTYYPNLYEERSLRTERFGYTFYGRMLSEKEIEDSGFDTISFEEWDKKRRFKFYYRWKIKFKRFLQDKFRIAMYDFE